MNNTETKTPKMGHAAPFEPVVTEEQRAALALAHCSTFRAERPIHELLRETIRLGEKRTAQLLWCHPSFIISWFPRRMPDGRMDSGWEPSGGFIGAALAILRSNTKMSHDGPNHGELTLRANEPKHKQSRALRRRCPTLALASC